MEKFCASSVLLCAVLTLLVALCQHCVHVCVSTAGHMTVVELIAVDMYTHIHTHRGSTYDDNLVSQTTSLSAAVQGRPAQQQEHT